jgi:hypothetical protein
MLLVEMQAQGWGLLGISYIMYPAKSNSSRKIISDDLSFDINYNNIKTTNVNATTNKLAPQKSMANRFNMLKCNYIHY